MNDVAESDPEIYKIDASPETVNWGFFDNSIKPVCRIKSGDIVRIETITHQAGDAPNYLSDPVVENIYESITPEERGPGVHLMTGPVYIEGASPGDVIECRILDLEPRIPYGVNLTANWGLLHDEFNEQEYITVYKIDNKTDSVKPVFQYEYPGTYDEIGPWIDPSTVNQTPVLDDISIPTNYHFGTAGVAPAENGKIDSVPPGIYGGNIDNAQFSIGSSMYYPVQVEGGLFVAGDSHIAQGDGEVSGTAIEASLNALVQFFIHTDLDFGAPVLETSTHWVTHGFNEDLEVAAQDAGIEMINLLCRRLDFTRSSAYSLLSIASDFHVTQVVNGTKGIHCIINKDII
jgi:acetamidase/formamidase